MTQSLQNTNSKLKISSRYHLRKKRTKVKTSKTEAKKKNQSKIHVIDQVNKTTLEIREKLQKNVAKPKEFSPGCLHKCLKFWSK